MSVATPTQTTHTAPTHVDDHNHEADHGHEPPFVVQLRNNRLGLWLFCFSELFLFGALLVARFVLWGDTRPALSQEIGLIATCVLLLSSFSMNRAETAIAHGDRGRFLRNMIITAVLGVIFFIGVVVLEWNIFGLEAEIAGVELFGHLRPAEHGVYAGVFFAMTGVHALHIISGIIFILIAWNLGRRGHYTAEKHWGVEATAIYWHFVDIVWVFFYPALYLIGRAVPIS